MKNKGSLLLLILLGSIFAQGQYAEFGLMGGASNYNGDLANEIVFSESHAAGGLMFKYNFNQTWAWRIAAMGGTISGSDANFDEFKSRNLSFQSNIAELSNVFEFNYTPFDNRKLASHLTTYLYTGISIFRFNPKASVDGKLVELQPLNTEMRSSNYSLIQLAIPMGGGVKYALTRNWIVGLDVGFRKTFTDYLDDVSTVYPTYDQNDLSRGRQLSDRSWELTEDSQPLAEGGESRGNPELKDWFMFTTVTLSYRFTPIVCWPTKRLPIRYN